jgi:uncharacterized protein (UPF0332 family)
MDTDKSNLYLQRAKNEINLANAIFKISTDNKLKLDLELKEDSTFFSNVISNSYYCIFYSAKALLESRGIKTEMPDEHKKTLEEFEKIVNSGEIDKELLIIYKSLLIRADELLGIFQKEKKKRGEYTYYKLPQSNMDPAKESLNNAQKFLKNINLIIQRK